MASRRPQPTGVRSRFKHQRPDRQRIHAKRRTAEQGVFEKLRRQLARRKERVSLRGRASRITGARKFARYRRKPS